MNFCEEIYSYAKRVLTRQVGILLHGIEKSQNWQTFGLGECEKLSVFAFSEQYLGFQIQYHENFCRVPFE